MLEALPAEPPLPARPRYVPTLVVLLVSLTGAAWLWWTCDSPLERAVNSLKTFSAPGVQQLNLTKPGVYTLFAESSARFITASGAHAPGNQRPDFDYKLTAPNGTAVRIEHKNPQPYYWKDNQTATYLGEFTVDRPGAYQLITSYRKKSIDPFDEIKGRRAPDREMGPTVPLTVGLGFRDAVLWGLLARIGAFLLGGVSAIAGLVLAVKVVRYPRPSAMRAHLSEREAAHLDLIAAVLRRQRILRLAIAVVAAAAVISDGRAALEGGPALSRTLLGVLGLLAAALGPRFLGWPLACLWALIQLPYYAWSIDSGSPTAQSIFKVPFTFSLTSTFSGHVVSYTAVGINLVGVLFMVWLWKWRREWNTRLEPSPARR
jgi:hypothetical protein